MKLDAKFKRRYKPAEGMTYEHQLQLYEHIVQKHRSMILFHSSNYFRKRGYYRCKDNNNQYSYTVLLDIYHEAVHIGKTLEELSEYYLKRLARNRTSDFIRDYLSLERQQDGDELPQIHFVHHAPYLGDEDDNSARHGYQIVRYEQGVVGKEVSYEEREAFYRPLINALRGPTERKAFEMYFLRRMKKVEIAQALDVSQPRVTTVLKESVSKIVEKIRAGEFEESLGSPKDILDTLIRMIDGGMDEILVINR